VRRASRFAGLALFAPTAVLAQQLASEPNRYGCGPYMMDWGGGWYGMIFGPLFMIFLLALVIASAVLFTRWIGGMPHSTAPHHHVPPGRTPLDILKERYARGEINKEEFEERRRVLGD
jgi:putative membrane protein